MTTTITAPKAQIPIGTVVVNGVRFEVAQHPEFVRFFFDLMRRNGGTVAQSNEDLQKSLQALQAGEMTNQPMILGELTAETIQQVSPEQIFSDVMQSGMSDIYGGEMTWQRI